MKKTLFIKNAAILTFSSLLLRFAGIFFKVWLASKIGSEGIGLYQLVFSVYVLASTFATSGISTAVTRLVTEELALGNKKSSLKIIKQAIGFSLIAALLSAITLFFGADTAAKHFLNDMRASSALRLIPIALPFMGISSCLRGYFIARRQATPNAAAQIFEQAVRIGLIAVLINTLNGRGLDICCAAIILGDCISEAVSCLILFLLFVLDKCRLSTAFGRKQPPYSTVKELLRISVPITSGRYLNSLLRTGENLLVPKSLAKYPLSGGKALSQFGMIKGMALPILFFPSAILNAISTLLIPEMCEATARRQRLAVKFTTRKIIKLTSVISYIFAAIFFVAGKPIGRIIYNSDEIGYLLRALSPIVPLMYVDSVSDGLLKGLDKQSFCFKAAVSDSAIRIALIPIALPLLGLNGFIGIMYLSNMLTCFMNVGKLIKTTGAYLMPVKEILLPLVTAVTVTLSANYALSQLEIKQNIIYVALLCAISLSAYFALMLLLGITPRREFT